MFYVYVLYSLKDKKLYIGFTQNLKKRFSEHQSKKVFSTKGRGPLKLIFFEGYVSQIDALRREKYFKTNKGKRTLKLMLKDYFSTV
jgi:putative endonuclease